MKALRNIHGTDIKKNQAIPEGKYSKEQIAVWVKYKFVAVAKKSKATTKKKAEKVVK